MSVSFDPNLLKDILNADLEQLIVIRLSSPLSRSETFYVDCLISFFRGDITTLKNLAGSFPQPELFMENNDLMEAIVLTRLAIRKQGINKTDLDSFSKEFENAKPTLFLAELFFVLGIAYTNIGQHILAQSSYLRASKLFSQFSLDKKSLKCLLNYLVMESHIHPEKKLLVDYRFLLDRAIRCPAPCVAGVACMNMSREYQLVGAYNVALKYANQALDHLKIDFGSNHYYLALAQRAHVLTDLGRNREAELEYESLLTAPFSDIKEATKVLASILHKDQQQVEKLQTEKLVPTWVERYQDLFQDENGKIANFGALEQRLLELISERTMSFQELTLNLYGEQIDSESATNRLKVLLNRLKKKTPGLIVRTEGGYKIADEVFLSRID